MSTARRTAARSSTGSRSSSSRPAAFRAKLPEAFAPLFSPARYKGFYGGRGSGKSHSVATALVILARQRPLRVLAAREIQKSIRDSSKRLLDDKIAGLGLGRFFASTDTEIRGLNGSLFLFAGLRTNAEAIKSMEGIDVAWVEEANTVSRSSLDILVPTVRKPGSELWFTWNPRQPTDPVDAMFRGAHPPPDSVIRAVNFDANPWFPAVLDAERLWDRRRDPDKYAHVWEGAYQRHSEARVFRNWRIDWLDVPAEGPDAVPRLGADWGFAADPTVLVRCWILGRTLYIDREAYRVGCPIDETPALFREVEDERTPDVAKWPVTADSARPELIDHLRRKGWNLQPSRKGAGSVEEGVAFLQDYDIVVHPDCRHAIDELTLYSYRTDPLTGAVLPILRDAHNHVIDALRYAIEGVRNATTGLIEFYRREVERAGKMLPGAPREAAPSEQVRMRAAAGISTAYGVTGRPYAVDATGHVLVDPDDVAPLRAAGFQEAL